jgi:hypothetical protein
VDSWVAVRHDFSSEAAARESLGVCRIYREAVIHHSPGLQPWVTQANEPPCLSAVVSGKRETKEEKWRPNGLFWAWCVDSVSRANIAILDCTNKLASAQHIGRHS